MCVADRELREVLGISLTLDGFGVRPAADEAEAARLLADHAPDLLLLDGTMPLSEAPTAWVDRRAPDTPVVILAERMAAMPEPTRPDVGLLHLPFGRAELLRCVELVRAAHAARRRAAAD